MYYVIETEYAGPNPQQHLNSHEFRIQTVPGRLNMSHEPAIHGWLGTDNDWSHHAHGKFNTLEIAKAEIARLTYGEYREGTVDPLDCLVEYDADGTARGELVYLALAGALEIWDAASSQDWCFESMTDTITDISMDDQIKAWLDECANTIVDEYGGKLDVEAVYRMAVAYRQELQEAAQ